MSEFAVNTDRLRTEADRLRALSNKMSSIEARLASVRISSALRASSAATLNLRIRDSKNAADNHASNLSKLSAALDSVANLYDRTERDLSDPKTAQEADNGGFPGIPDITDIFPNIPRFIGLVYWPALLMVGPHLVLGGSGTGAESGGFLDEDGNWSLLSGERSGSGSFLGIPCAGEVGYSLIGIETDTTAEAKWNLDKGEAGAELGGEASFHLAKGEASGNIGILGGKVDGSVGNAAVSGNVHLTVMKDGKFSPSLGAEAKGSANVAQGSAEGYLGNEDYNAHAKAKGSVLGAEAKAGVEVGKITYTDEKTGETVSAYGAEAEVGAEAYLAEGKVSGGVTIMGIDIDIGVSGKAGGAGVEAGGRVTTNGVSGEIGAGLGLGAGVEISIDWSDFDPPTMEEIGESIQEVGQNIGEGLQAAGEAINEGLDAAGDAISDGFRSAGEAISDFFNW